MYSLNNKSKRLFLLLALGLVLAVGARTVVLAQEDDQDEEAARQAYFDRMEADIQASLDEPEASAMGATPCVGGFAGPYACENVDLMAFMPLATIGGGSGSSSWGWTDPLDGKEYAIFGRSNGTSFIDITDPVNPIYLGNLPPHGSNSSWREMKVYNDYVFIGSEAFNHGMQIFDLTRLRDVITPPVTFTEDEHYAGFGSSHTIAINEDSGFAYALGSNTCSGGMHFVNIQDPLNPINAGCYSGDGYSHDAQCVTYNGPDADYQGDEICFGFNEDTVTVVNVTNKAAPVLIKKQGYAGSGYTHQGWVTDDHTYLLIDDEFDELNFGHNTRTWIWDISNLDAPIVIGFFDAAFDSIDHNQFILNGYVYQSNYTSGLQILDLTDISSASLSRVAYFDTYTPNNNASFNGSWNNYPYYESGVVTIADINSGLFIVQPNLVQTPDYSVSATPSLLEVCTSGEALSTIDIEALAGYTGTVALSAVGLPAGSSAEFSEDTVIVPGSSVLTVTVSTTPQGTYPFDVHGDDGTIEHDEALTLEVLGVASPPTLVFPADGATDVGLDVTFTWNAVAGATGYNIEIATDSGFTDVIDSATVAGTSYPVGVALDHLTTYYWHVSASNECGTGVFSAARSFTTEAAPPLELKIYLPLVLHNE